MTVLMIGLTLLMGACGIVGLFKGGEISEQC